MKVTPVTPFPEPTTEHEIGWEHCYTKTEHGFDLRVVGAGEMWRWEIGCPGHPELEPIAQGRVGGDLDIAMRIARRTAQVHFEAEIPW